MEGRTYELFMELHRGLPRQGPGDAASTARAFSMVRGLPEKPRILDAGCGPGRQAVDLARLTPGRIIALDSHGPFLEQLRGGAAVGGFAGRIRPVLGDMSSLPFREGAFDLIWSEGAVYIMGFGQGLSSWRPYLSPGGHMAVTEICWLKPDPPDEISRYWDECYPAMRDVEGNLATIREAGFEPIGHFTLPESAWWEDYYTPLERNLAAFEAARHGDEEAIVVAAEERREIDVYRRYSDYYGYVFFVMKTSSHAEAATGPAG